MNVNSPDLTPHSTPRRRGRPVGTLAPKSGAVRRVRDALGLTQQQLAGELGCSVSAVQKMEQQSHLPSHGTLLVAFERLAKRADVAIDEK